MSERAGDYGSDTNYSNIHVQRALADQPINGDGCNGGRDSGIELFVGEDIH
jgi:hypothetical protein